MLKVQVRDIKIFYQVAGEGEPILWIAGLGSDHTAWGYQVQEFSGSYRCIAFDNRDAGQTDPSPKYYSIRTMADDTAGLMDKLAISRANVVGWSMGGAIAQELAINYPEKVDRLCLVATYHKGDPRGAELLGSWKLMRRIMGPLEFMAATYPWVFTHRAYFRPGFIEDMKKRAFDNPFPQSMDANCRQADAAVAHDTEERLSLIQAPTLVIAGDEDILTPLRFAHALAEKIPRAKLAIIKEVGHGLLWEKPQELNHALMDFLKPPGGARTPHRKRTRPTPIERLAL